MRNVSSSKRAILPRSKAKSVAHDIVVVREANKKSGTELDPDIQRLQVSFEQKKVISFPNKSQRQELVTYLNIESRDFSLNL